jgi:AraC-like DNA-binding protein
MRAFVTPSVAIWIPDGAPYALDVRSPCRLRILYADGTIAPSRAFGPVEMTPLLRELVERAVADGFLDPAEAQHRNVLSVLRDELASLCDANAASVLVLPADAALRDVAERFVAQPDDVRSIRDVAASVGMSLRTFERRFARETGLAPRDWVRRARLIAALASLATGASVTEAGLACGYSSISAFISAFGALHGVTPGTCRPSHEVAG